AFLRTLRAQLNAIRSGYQITYDTTGYIGNYPLEASVGATAADAVFVMGYDYRTAGSSTSGSIDPLSGPTYDLADTVRQYTARISPSRVILGVPWYGRAWSTTTSLPRAANQSGAKFGYSTAVNYENIPALVSQYGRRWDPVEQSPYIAYQRQNCTSAYGCVTSWRQVWYDDAASLAGRYQLVNDYGLRGAGMWALGYDGAYQDMVRALSNAFLVDHAAPQAGIRALPVKNTDEGIVVAWAASDVSGVRSYDVQVSADGGPWTTWLTQTTQTTDVWLGTDGHAYAFRVRATDLKGNVGAWNVTSTAATAPASLAVGGFGRVTLNGLSYRSGPDTSAVKLGSLPAGTIVALTSGPVSSGGYLWYEVTQPIREWSPVTFVERGVWIAAKSSTATNVVPFHAPNATVVDAGLTGFDFGPGTTGSSAAAVAARAFSPNGDGARDSLRVNWTATVALNSLALKVLRASGALLGSINVPILTTGRHAFTWDGKVGGVRVPDGQYLLQLVGTAGTTTYRAPSAMPATAGQIAAFAVTVDTVPPVITSASASTSLISPNGDGIRDTAAFTLRATGATSSAMRVAPSSPAGAPPIRTATVAGGALSVAWNGRDYGGTVVPDGTYTVTLAACDAAGNCALRMYPMRVDTTPAVVAPSAAPSLFSPNGDGAADTATLAWTASESTSGVASVWRGTTLVRRWVVAASLGGRVTWDGRNSAGSSVADGRYTFKVDVRDTAGNRTVAVISVTVDRTVGLLRWSRNFYPQDGDALAPTSVLTWTLTRTATTTLGLYDASGNLVRTVWSGKSQLAGVRSWTWNGKLANGAYVAQGLYWARLTVVSPYGTQILTRPVWVSAFPGSLSSTSVRAGQVLSVSFATTEPLRNAPQVTFAQPGLGAVTVTGTRLGNGTYVARFAVRAGPAGSATVRIAATDTGGHGNATVYTLMVRP
ncbi:MAG TPA: FlgD immunoglobulin-like domain containing protein, partial [Candidatus Limnocylindrales bacterium]